MNWGTVFELLSAPLKEAGFATLDGAGADRHGAWESTWVRQCSRNRAEFVTLAFTDQVGSGATAMEVWCGAEEGDRFARVLVWTLPESVAVSMADPGVLADLLSPALNSAVQMAHAIPFSEMTGRIPTFARGFPS